MIDFIIYCIIGWFAIMLAWGLLQILGMAALALISWPFEFVSWVADVVRHQSGKHRRKRAKV